jgi:hypothetical protein
LSEGPFIVLSIRRVLIVASFLVSTSGFLFAQFAVPTRLDPSAWPKFQPLVWWKSAPEDSKINVVARYTVDPEPTEDHGKYSVMVHYRLLGTFDPGLGYVREAEGTIQDVYFSVTSQNTEWRIANSDNPLPHPSRAAMIKWLTAQIALMTDATLKARYQSALENIQQQSASPFAK